MLADGPNRFGVFGRSAFYVICWVGFNFSGLGLNPRLNLYIREGRADGSNRPFSRPKVAGAWHNRLVAIVARKQLQQKRSIHPMNANSFLLELHICLAYK
jgi:hypothetical protein